MRCGKLPGNTNRLAAVGRGQLGGGGVPGALVGAGGSGGGSKMSHGQDEWRDASMSGDVGHQYEAQQQLSARAGAQPCMGVPSSSPYASPLWHAHPPSHAPGHVMHGGSYDSPHGSQRNQPAAHAHAMLHPDAMPSTAQTGPLQRRNSQGGAAGDAGKLISSGSAHQHAAASDHAAVARNHRRSMGSDIARPSARGGGFDPVGRVGSAHGDDEWMNEDGRGYGPRGDHGSPDAPEFSRGGANRSDPNLVNYVVHPSSSNGRSAVPASRQGQEQLVNYVVEKKQPMMGHVGPRGDHMPTWGNGGHGAGHAPSSDRKTHASAAASKSMYTPPPCTASESPPSGPPRYDSTTFFEL